MQWTSIPGNTGIIDIVPILTSQVHRERVVHCTSVPCKYGTIDRCTWKIRYNGLVCLEKLGQSTIVTSLVHLQKVVHWTSIPGK